MDLDSLARRIEHDLGEDKDFKEVRLMTPGGRRYEILSLNWDEDHDEWVLIGDRS